MEIVDWITPGLLLALFAWQRHDLAELRRDVAALAERLTQVEGKLGERITSLEERMTSLGERVARMEATLDLVAQGLRIDLKRRA